jgi:hypothetical protein
MAFCRVMPIRSHRTPPFGFEQRNSFVNYVNRTLALGQFRSIGSKVKVRAAFLSAQGALPELNRHKR